jgi:hypothetical protein
MIPDQEVAWFAEFPGPLQEPAFHSYWGVTAYIGLSDAADAANAYASGEGRLAQTRFRVKS